MADNIFRFYVEQKNNKSFDGYGRVTRVNKDIDPDEIFLDSSNLPNFDNSQFEGRIVKPISGTGIAFLAVFFFSRLPYLRLKFGIFKLLKELNIRPAVKIIAFITRRFFQRVE